MQLYDCNVSKHLLYQLKISKKVTQTQICITLIIYIRLPLEAIEKSKFQVKRTANT